MKVGPLRLYPQDPCTDPAYRALIAARNPAAWWPMDDNGGSGGDLADASGHGLHASLNPGDSCNYLQPGPQGAPCSFAIEPSGFFNTNVTIGASQHYAIMLTLRADGLPPSDKTPIGNWFTTGTMLYTQFGDLQVYHGATAYVPGYTVPMGDWFHALYGWDGSIVSLWINGVNMLSAGTGSGPGVGDLLFIATYANRGISAWDGALQHGVVFLDGDADAILNDTEAALLAAAAMGA